MRCPGLRYRLRAHRGASFCTSRDSCISLDRDEKHETFAVCHAGVLAIVPRCGQHIFSDMPAVRSLGFWTCDFRLAVLVTSGEAARPPLPPEKSRPRSALVFTSVYGLRGSPIK